MRAGRPKVLLLAAILAWLAAFTGTVLATPFQYHDYDGMIAELESLAAAYPELTELFTAQDRWGLPTIPDGELELSNYILRITNESVGLDKPELLLEGVQHGDEVVGLEVGLVLARLLLESYGTDPWLTDLVDRREIYFVPLSNPWGFNHHVRFSPGGEPGSEDMNRDHIYDRCDFGCSDDTSLSTTGARALWELSRRHLFRVMLDYHGGVEMIIHPWGSPVHPANFESPDNAGHDFLGQRMSAFGGPFNGPYDVGTASALLGPVNGPLDDTSYASTWDAGNADPLWPTAGAGALSYTVEISDLKTPPESTLGGDADLLTPGGSEDGYVPKNVRIGLAAIDIAEPWVVWENRPDEPIVVATGEPVEVEWKVRGCFQVDDTHVRIGSQPDPLDTFASQTDSQSQTTGSPCFGEPTLFTAEVTFDRMGTYYMVPAAKVDSVLLMQDDPSPPGTAPQSWIVRGRTEEGEIAFVDADPLDVNTVQARLYWGAEPLQVFVGSADVIFTDGFESGDLSSWGSVEP